MLIFLKGTGLPSELRKKSSLQTNVMVYKQHRLPFLDGLAQKNLRRKQNVSEQVQS